MSATSMRIPQRVLITADTIGGVWTYAVELSRGLAELGVSVGLATMGARLSSGQRAEIADIPHLTLFESTFKLEWMDEPRADVERAGHWLLELEQSFRPDIVHLNSFSHGAFPWRSPRIVVGHSCVLSWWRAVHGVDAPAEWDEYREAVMAGLHGANLVVAPSKAMLDALNEHYGPLKAALVIPNGRHALATHHGKHDFILAAGRLWDAAKNISTLADVAPRLPWPVMVAGSETDPEGRSASHSNVSHLGQLPAPDMASCFQRASIFASPARYEPFGLSILEAAQAGCALVLGDIPSLRENWNDAAIFVSPDDASALERILSDLIAAPDRLHALGAQAQARARQFTSERMIAGYLAAYSPLLRDSSDRSHDLVHSVPEHIVSKMPPADFRTQASTTFPQLNS